MTENLFEKRLFGRMRSRDEFPTLLNELKLAGEGAEIGVQDGLYSEILLQGWRGTLLHSVDPWQACASDQYHDIANVPHKEQVEKYLNTLRRLARFGGRSKVLRLTSAEAAPLFRDEALDFVYIDADHQYAAVAEDIRIWFPKVRKGGILGGHDFIPDGRYPFGDFGVQKALAEFLLGNDLKLIVAGDEKGFCSWFILKP